VGIILKGWRKSLLDMLHLQSILLWDLDEVDLLRMNEDELPFPIGIGRGKPL
jgi:hypothetical protein